MGKAHILFLMDRGVLPVYRMIPINDFSFTRLFLNQFRCLKSSGWTMEANLISMPSKDSLESTMKSISRFSRSL